MRRSARSLARMKPWINRIRICARERLMRAVCHREEETYPIVYRAELWFFRIRDDILCPDVSVKEKERSIDSRHDA